MTKGQSAFTTSESGAHVACFWLDGNHEEGAGRTIDIDWKIGITAKDWDSVAKKEKIEVSSFSNLFLLSVLKWDLSLFFSLFLLNLITHLTCIFVGC